MKQLFAGAALVLAVACGGPGEAGSPAPARFEGLALSAAGMEAGITPSFGGRLMSFNRPGHASIVYFDHALARANPAPEISYEAGDIGYFGHAVWLGPQSQWWNRQDVAPARAGEWWPPDPHLQVAPTQVLAAGEKEIVLEGEDSPVSGVRMRQRYAIVDDNTLAVEAEARNIRQQSISWDIWFNTRVVGAAAVYVPVAGEGAVIRSDAGANPERFDAPVYAIENGLLRLERLPAAQGREGHRGKLLITPEEGWMAAFHDGQAFIIEFPLTDDALIHPEHGQVELYQNRMAAAPLESFTEMELHGPYGPIPAGLSRRAGERWHLFAYDGPDEPAAHAAFLEEITRTLAEDK